MINGPFAPVSVIEAGQTPARKRTSRTWQVALCHPIRKGELITAEDVEAPDRSTLWQLRAEQDELFHPQTR